MQHSSQKILIESERFNNTPPRVPFTIEEEIFGPQYERGQFFGFREKGISSSNLKETSFSNPLGCGFWLG
ncbi:hypothetical protein RhiirA1_455446 [Rhizophagus irregularis]|uniref:Uncharacterized protein n=1 Tax=Rhizophagus irregularis TaxID=588596 RepID=A0A2N0S2S9_9GLOM|nr:hypothetical protein RhiirA1_455446 [Rhizophagus irregularis]